MTSFIQCDDGFINLDYVAKITKTKKSGEFGERLTIDFYGPDGSKLDTINRDVNSTDIEQAMAPLVSAALGATAYVLGIWSGGKRPAWDDIYIEEIPIVAWRILAAEPIPVSLNDNLQSRFWVVLLPLPGGAVRSQQSRNYESLDDTKHKLLKGRQDEWDSTHAAATTD